MKKKPLVSFCIATYKRPSLLKKTILSIFAQNYFHTEIVVADNDPAQSAKPVIDSFSSNKIIYVPQKKNVGMVKNFQTAFYHSRGDYIVFTSDDDPFEEQMIERLLEMREKYPKAGSYFGAPYLSVSDPIVMKLHNLKKGKNSMLKRNEKQGEIRLLTPNQFLKAFLNYQIFNYFLWSCGMVRRNIVEKVGAVKSLCGSNYLTDFAYIIRVGLSAPMVTMNTEFGSQSIHRNNFGRSNEDLITLKQAVKGFYEQCESQAKKLHCQQDLRNFIRNWVKEQLLSVLRFRRITGETEDKRFFIQLYLDLAFRHSFFRPGITEFFIRTYFPTLAKFYDDSKWIFEKRTIKRGIGTLFYKPPM